MTVSRQAVLFGRLKRHNGAEAWQGCTLPDTSVPQTLRSVPRTANR